MSFQSARGRAGHLSVELLGPQLLRRISRQQNIGASQHVLPLARRHINEITNLGNLPDRFGNDGPLRLFRLKRDGDEEAHDDGVVSHDGRVLGTYLHGLFDSSDGVAWLLNHWCRICNKPAIEKIVDPRSERERRYDALADHFREHMRLDLIYRALG